ncbi:unnamed protein product [Urochloa decumbens]|uniref:Agenet-like domain-containing protein n=1 Tax=Urochloa decumbens TaxID=240449 RepID=A0ABC9AP45_9POAL
MAAGRTPAPTARRRRRRRGRGWSAPKKPRSPSPPPHSPSSSALFAAGEPPLLPPGTDVEVRLDGEGYFGTWYEATVVKSTPSPPLYTVRHADLHASNGSGALSELFAPTHVRPRPPAPPPHRVTKTVQFLKPHYSWDAENWTISSVERESASGKRTRSNKVSFCDDEQGHHLEYSGAKKTRKKQPQQVGALAEGSEHASVSMIGSPLSVVDNSPACIDRPNSSSPLHGHSTVPKTDGFDNNLLQKRYCKVHLKKITSKEKKCSDEPHNLHSSLESPTMVQKIGVNEVAGSQRESPLTLETTKSTQQLLDRTEDTINTNEVTYQETLAMVPCSVEPASNDIDVQVSELDEGLIVPTPGCGKNGHDGALGNNTGTQVPFVKTFSQFWPEIDGMDVFKEFPQQPHFLPLEEYLPELREGKAFGLMLEFILIAKSIRKSSIEDDETSFDEKKCVLAQLKTHGFEVHCLETLLDEVIKVKFRYTKHLEELSSVGAQKLGPTSALERNDSLLCGFDEEMAELDQKLGQLRQKTRLIEKENENHLEELSKLNVVESSVKKALDADKQQFNSILAGMLRKQLAWNAPAGLNIIARHHCYFGLTS